jgi:hypothetical protein
LGIGWLSGPVIFPDITRGCDSAHNDRSSDKESAPALANVFLEFFICDSFNSYIDFAKQAKVFFRKEYATTGCKYNFGPTLQTR